MRVAELNNVELYNAMLVGREFNRMSGTPMWREAFARYNRAHGTKLKPNCGQCFDAVKKWLKQ